MLTEHLADIAAYCKVDADDAELPGFVDAAAAYLAGAGVREPQDGSPRYAQYLQCVKYLALDLYDRRDTAVMGRSATIPPFGASSTSSSSPSLCPIRARARERREARDAR